MGITQVHAAKQLGISAKYERECGNINKCGQEMAMESNFSFLASYSSNLIPWKYAVDNAIGGPHLKLLMQ
jgi:hypothetical protein